MGSNPSLVYQVNFMNLLLEFNRNDLSNAKDKLLQDIESIKKGNKLTIGELQTRWMSAIGDCSDLLQKCRKAQLKKSLSKEQNELVKKLEDEWKMIYPICKEYESLIPLYNRKFPNNKLQTFKERIGKILIESKNEYFDY